jgi:hypothetical protein
MTFGPVVIGTTRADVTTTGGTPVTPPPVVPTIDVTKARAGLEQFKAGTPVLEAAVGQLNAQISALQREADALGTLVEAIKQLSNIRDSIAAVASGERGILNKGPW